MQCVVANGFRHREFRISIQKHGHVLELVIIRTELSNLCSKDDYMVACNHYFKFEIWFYRNLY